MRSLRSREVSSGVRRACQETPEFAARYAAGAGVEGTIAQGVATCGLRHARYRGLAKTIPTECPALDDGTPARNHHGH